jgi:excinuclease ABC subunit B
VVVATVSAIYGIGDPSEYHSMILHLRQGDVMSQRDAIKRLTEMQYQRNDTDFRRGTFRVHGDVLDIFPAEHADNALRLSLFDDEVESLQLFDPLTGHIRQKLARFTVFPSSHYVTGRQKVLDAVEKIKVELAQQKEFFASQVKLIEAQRIEQRTRFDLEMMIEIGFCKGIENYSRHLSGRAPGDTGRLPAVERAGVHRRVARDDPSGRRDVQGRPGAQGESGQLRIPTAVRARQSTAALRRIREIAAADDLRVGDASGL